jgi:hypothetical protein
MPPPRIFQGALRVVAAQVRRRGRLRDYERRYQQCAKRERPSSLSSASYTFAFSVHFDTPFILFYSTKTAHAISAAQPLYYTVPIYIPENSLGKHFPALFDLVPNYFRRTLMYSINV